MNPSVELLPVIQADRVLYCEIMGLGDKFAAPVMRGDFDREKPLQDIATHRIEHSTPDRNAVLEEAAMVADNYQRMLGSDKVPHFVLSEIAARIRALKTTTPEPTDTAEILIDEAELLGRSALPAVPAGVSGVADTLSTASKRAIEQAAEAVHEGAKNYWPGSQAAKDAEAIQRRILALRTPAPVLEVAKEALENLDRLLDFNEPASDDKPLVFADWTPLNAAFGKARAALQTLAGAGQ